MHLLLELPAEERPEHLYRLRLAALKHLGGPVRADVAHREMARAVAEAQRVTSACRYCAWREADLLLPAARRAFAAHRCVRATPRVTQTQEPQ